jgi:putative SOS response-associated peptidase YedK
MCGRYTLAKPFKSIVTHFKTKTRQLGFKERFNIAPSQNVPTVVYDGQNRRISVLRWGLIPHWAKDGSMGMKTINARAETISEKPSFRDSFKSKRCLVPADGFIEWARNSKEKTPKYINLKSNELFGMAGLWAEWNGNGESIQTFSIVTTEANDLIGKVHHRMPVILNPESYSKWLDPAASSAQLKSLLVPYAPQEMNVRSISKVVNSTKNDSPDCLNPTEQTNLFPWD